MDYEIKQVNRFFFILIFCYDLELHKTYAYNKKKKGTVCIMPMRQLSTREQMTQQLTAKGHRQSVCKRNEKIRR